MDRQTDLSKDELLALGAAHKVQGLTANMREDTLEGKLADAGVPLPPKGDAGDGQASTGAQPPPVAEENRQDDSPPAPDRGDEDGDAPGDGPTAIEEGDDTHTGSQPAPPVVFARPQESTLPVPPRGDEGDRDPGGRPTAVTPVSLDDLDEEEQAVVRKFVEQILSEHGLIGGRPEPAGPPEPTLLQQVQDVPVTGSEQVSTEKAIKAANKAGADLTEADVLGVTVRRATGPDGKATGPTGVVVIDHNGRKHPAWID